MKGFKDFRKFLVLPIVYLILDLVEDFFIYKAEVISNIWAKTGAIIGILAFGISFVAFALVPFFQGGLETLHKTSKKNGGIGEFVFAVVLIAVIYFIYYIKTDKGLTAVLPPFLLN